jgi:hypothetical protein
MPWKEGLINLWKMSFKFTLILTFLSQRRVPKRYFDNTIFAGDAKPLTLFSDRILIIDFNFILSKH